MFLLKIKYFAWIFQLSQELFLRNLENGDNTGSNRTWKSKSEAKEVLMQILKLKTFLTQNWQNLWVFPCTLNENLTFCWDFDWWYSRMQILRIQKIVRHTPQGKEFQKEETLIPSQPVLSLHTWPSHTYTHYINHMLHFWLFRREGCLT